MVLQRNSTEHLKNHLSNLNHLSLFKANFLQYVKSSCKSIIKSWQLNREIDEVYEQTTHREGKEMTLRDYKKTHPAQNKKTA